MNGIFQLGLTVYLKQDEWFTPTRINGIPTRITRFLSNKMNGLFQLG